MSMYRFRDPGEEFAELYVSHRVAILKGSKTSEKRKTWFEKHGLRQDDPSSEQPGLKLPACEK